MNIDLARLQWQDGNRRVEETRPNRDRYLDLTQQVDVVVAGLRKRVGQVFTLDELGFLLDIEDLSQLMLGRLLEDAAGMAKRFESLPPRVLARAWADYADDVMQRESLLAALYDGKKGVCDELGDQPFDAVDPHHLKLLLGLEQDFDATQAEHQRQRYPQRRHRAHVAPGRARR